LTKLVCSIDTCFLIEWSRYRKRELLTKVFNYGYITEDILAEIKSEQTLEFASKLLSSGFLVIYPFKRELEESVRKIIETSIHDPRIRIIDPPEAYALAIGLREKCIVLTENKGVLRLVELYHNDFPVTVWGAYELLKFLYKKGYINNFWEELKNYTHDTHHMFPRRKLWRT